MEALTDDFATSSANRLPGHAEVIERGLALAWKLPPKMVGTGMEPPAVSLPLIQFTSACSGAQ